MTGYAGTPHSFSTLSAMPAHERNAALAEALFNLDKQIEPLKAARDEAERWLKQYAFEQGEGTTVIDGGRFTVSVKESVRWEYDVEGLSQIQAFGVQPEQYDAAVKPTWKIDKAALNRLIKRGGRVKAIIEQACRKHVIGVVLEVKEVPNRERLDPRVYDNTADPVTLDLH